MATATIVQQNSDSASSGTTLTVTLPAATAAARTLLVAVQCPPVSATISTPTGFGVDASVANGSTVGRVALFRKVTTAGENTWPVTVSSDGGNWWAAEVSGLNAIPLDRTATSTGANSASAASGALATDTTQPDEFAVAVVGVMATAGPTFSGWTNGFTEQTDRANGGAVYNGSIGVATRNLSATGIYSTTATISGSGFNCGLLATYKVDPLGRFMIVSTDPADRNVYGGPVYYDPAFDPGAGRQLIAEVDALAAGYSGYPLTVVPHWEDRTPSEFAANVEMLRLAAAASLTMNPAFLAIGAPTNAELLAQVQALTRQVTALVRLQLEATYSVDGT